MIHSFIQLIFMEHLSGRTCLVKNPPAMQETLVRLLGQEDPLEKGMATYSRSGLENSMNPIVHGVAKSQT